MRTLARLTTLLSMTAAMASAAANDGPRLSIESDALISEYVSRATLNTLVEQVLSGGRPCNSVSAASLLERRDGFLLCCDRYRHTYAMTSDRGVWRISSPLAGETPQPDSILSEDAEQH